MCRTCLREVQPDRGTTVYEGGAYFLNFKGCAQCGHKMVKNVDKRVEEGDDGEETITLAHTCESCAHVVCEHLYTFRVEDGYQEFNMTCDLCGTGEDTASVAPTDSRKVTQVF